MKERLFFASTPALTLLNVLGFVSDLFQIWTFSESRPDRKRQKHQTDTNELVEGLNSQMTDLNSRMGNFEQLFKQLNCRFDTVHATRKSISPECLKYILPPTHQAPTILARPIAYPEITHNSVYESDQHHS